MVMMKTSNRWLGLLSAAVMASAVGVSAYSGYYTSGMDCYDNWIGDGYCDNRNNNELCNYDGGDCCECTCTVGEGTDDDYRCGQYSDFACVDPAAPCVDDDDITIDMAENCGYPQGIGNGWCDMGNNNAGCGYDGGDCCQCTCVAPENSWDDDNICGDQATYACIDPEAACVDDDDITIIIVENCAYPGSIGNGWCDNENNKAECNYDGGDCCECTCTPPENSWDDDWACSNDSGFACIDPEAPCSEDDDITPEMVENCSYPQNIGNGWCDHGNNKPECDYDGGDCCECTCDAGDAGDDDYRCSPWGGFACIDPEAPCVDDDSVTVDMMENCNWPMGIGNGWCDIGNNIPECNYDGGDCCECTCEVSDHYDDDYGYAGCLEFACIDPDAECSNDDDITIDMFEDCGWVLGIGNGYCDRENNNAECGYDGGDCCYCTCESSNHWDDDWSCSTNGSGFNCKDQSAPCFGEEPPTSSDDHTSFTDDSTTYEFVPWEQVGPLPTVDGAVEVGTKTEVGVTATSHDPRPGRSSYMNGCGEEGGDGCAPANSHDGIASATESRWSCASKDVEGGGPCQIEYTFAEPQDIIDIQVAFWKGDERIRTLDVYLNGEKTHMHESHSRSAFNSLGVTADEVTTVMLESTGLTADEWISILEVLIFVKPEPLPTVEGAVEVGTKTEVAVAATAYDMRPGMSSGCGEEGGDGCAPANSHDGVAYQMESRWSCATKLVEGGGPCQIVYTFAEPQHIVDIQVAFWKGNERIRTLDVHLNGEKTHTHESYAGSTFNTLGVAANEITTVMLESTGLMSDEWISLLEVLIFVKP